jgi:D-amino peptidase
MRLGGFTCLGLAFASLGFGQPRLKVYLSADMEGVVAAVTGDQLGPSGFEYQRFREFMTNELLAAIDGARAAGANEFLVSDSHGNGENLLVEKLPKDVELVRAWPRPLMMMQGIDESFQAAFFIGYHASTSNPAGVRAHTISSATFSEVRLNGKVASEALLSAAIAGHFGVPAVMLSGDDAIVAEARQQLGPLEGAVVKWAYGFHSARTLTPEAAYDVIRAAARRALGRLKDFKPYKLDTPVELDLSFKNYRPAEVLAYLPVVERTGSHSIRFRGKDVIEISKFIEFVVTYEPALSP